MLRNDKSRVKSASQDWSASIPACIERSLRTRTSLVDVRVSSNKTLFRVKNRRSMQARCLRSSHNAPVFLLRNISYNLSFSLDLSFDVL